MLDWNNLKGKKFKRERIVWWVWVWVDGKRDREEWVVWVVGEGDFVYVIEKGFLGGEVVGWVRLCD